MTRPRTANVPRPLPKAISAEDIAEGTARLQEVLASINDFSQEGFPYQDAARTKAELQLRECVKQIFGEDSREFHTYRNFKLRTSSQAEIAQSIAAIKGLLRILNDRQSEPQGSSLPTAALAATEKDTPMNTVHTRPTPPATQPSLTEVLVHPSSPPPSSIAQTTQAKLQSSRHFPPPSKPASPAAAPTATPLSVSATRQIRLVPPPPSAAVQRTLDALSFKLDSEQASLQLVRKVCLRLHTVARQLRLRTDSRPTIEVEDDHDLQDLLRALLKMEFDEVGVDEWTPPYAGNVPQTALVLNGEQITVVAKKTRSGLTAKEIAEQVAADSAFHLTRNTCTALFCFVYDPEGRIGNPKRLETDLTSVNDHHIIEVLVEPK